MENKLCNQYSNFNVDQLIPVINDLKLAQIIVKKIMDSLSEYYESLYEIQNEIKESGSLTNEIKAKIDKNVICLLNELSSNLNQMVAFKNVGTRKEKLFERLKRGITYKYKISNGSIVENPELLTFDVLRVNSIHRTLEIGNKIYQFSDSSDYAPDGGNDSCFTDAAMDLLSEANIAMGCVKKFQTEKEKVLSMQAFLDVLLSTIDFGYESIITDIIHFNLFDKENLENLLQN